MIPLARRYCAAALAGLAIAVLTVAVHRETAARFDPCADPAQLTHLDAFGAQYSIRHDGAAPHPLWVDGNLPPAVPNGRPLSFRFVRMDAPDRFYLGFDRILLQPPLPEDRKELRALRVGSDMLPVHRVVGGSSGPVRIARYFFVHGARPVAHPFPSGLKTVWDQLVRGTQPVSLFMVAGVGKSAALSAIEDSAEAWLAAAWTDYRRACRS
jgi:hypothetical protein